MKNKELLELEYKSNLLMKDKELFKIENTYMIKDI